MPVARIGKYEINYIDEGEGIPVVFIHGLAGDSTAGASRVKVPQGVT